MTLLLLSWDGEALVSVFINLPTPMPVVPRETELTFVGARTEMPIDGDED
jgi:hypothetical protein